MSKIIVFESGNTWMCDFVGNNTIKEAFGTTKLPTPFTNKTTLATVMEKIQNSNPNSLVQYRRNYA
jgi:hypothetical protein